MTFHVLTAEFSHETNTFNVRPTGFAAFQNRLLLLADDAIKERGNANTDLAGFLDVAKIHDWTVHHAISAAAPPAGRVTRDAFDRIAAVIVNGAREIGPKLDGILLALHGAMVTDFCEDGEGELLARLRLVAGRDLPIAITLDPHANVTSAMCMRAQIIISYKTYPHVDMRECGRQAAEILHRTMREDIRPVTIRSHCAMLEEVNGGRTDTGPMIGRIAKASAYEEEPDVFAVSINAGFGNADIAEVGPTVLVTAQGDHEAHQRFGQKIADDIWNHRHGMINEFLTVEAAAALCGAHDWRTGPIIVADYADNPGGGGYGDATNLLRALLAAGVHNACFGPLVDSEAVKTLHRQASGDTVSLSIGGKTDPRYGGPPLHVTGTIKLLSDGDYIGDGPMLNGLKGSWGPCAVLTVDDIEILIVTHPSQMLDLQQFSAFGIDPAKKSVVALKSMQHFRAAFEPIAAKVIICDSGGICTPDLRKLPYKNVCRPVFPLDH